MTVNNLRAITIALLVCISCPVQALSYQPPPIPDELASPFTESEAGGIGCLVVSLAVGSGMVYLLGGVEPIMATLATKLPAGQIIEGSAAIAFVFSSACYIGAVLAPITMATYTAVIDSMVPAPKFNRPNFLSSGKEGQPSGAVHIHTPHVPQSTVTTH
ncbi:hypothetical protein TI03_00250 [Achromatium sp. WMS1]|nr:hypothetical protein TI03_00250 [Achromatium sp. WMS1]